MAYALPPLQLAKLVLQLEAALRPVALAPEWRAGEGAGAGSRTPAASRAVSRATSTVDLAGAGTLCAVIPCKLSCVARI
jgi:hypothetical protein